MNIRRELERLNQKMEIIMTKIDDVLRDERAESDKIDALTKSQADLKSKLQAALAGENLSADTQKKIDDAFAQAEANNAKLDAMSSNDSGSGGSGVIGSAPPAGTPPVPGSEFQIQPDPNKSPTASLGPEAGGAATNNTAPIATPVEFNPDKPAGAATTVAAPAGDAPAGDAPAAADAQKPA